MENPENTSQPQQVVTQPEAPRTSIKDRVLSFLGTLNKSASTTGSANLYHQPEAPTLGVNNPQDSSPLPKPSNS